MRSAHSGAGPFGLPPGYCPEFRPFGIRHPVSQYIRNFARRTLIALAALQSLALWAADGGSILGTVTDPRGATVAGAAITATEITTGVHQMLLTDSRGFYAFQNLPVGRYDVQIAATGFQPVRRTGVALDVNSKIVVDIALALGERTEVITVSESSTHVETADTQLGEVITGEQMTAVPLNGRSYTDLLGLQPGVVPATSLTSNTVQDVGVSALFPSGDLNPGTVSINGQR
jgi:hypothetical protein